MKAWRGPVLATLIAALAGLAGARDFCLVPVQNGQPVGESEAHQFWNMAHDPHGVPGYPHLVFGVQGRGLPYTIVGDRLAEWTKGFLPYFGLAPRLVSRPDGSVLAFSGVGPKREPVVYRLAPGATEFQTLVTQADISFFAADYDPGSDRLLLHTDAGYVDADAALTGPPLLPPVDDARGGGSPRYLPDLGGWVVKDVHDLLFARAGDAGWQVLGKGQTWDDDMPRAQVRTLVPGQSVAVIDAGDLFMLERTPDGAVRMAYSLFPDNVVALDGDLGDIVVWTDPGSPWQMLWRSLASAPVVPGRPSRVTPAGLVPLPGTAMDRVGKAPGRFDVETRMVAIAGRPEVWFRGAQGLAFYDGTTIRAIPSAPAAALDGWSNVLRVGDGWVVSSATGLWRIGADLSVQKVPGVFEGAPRPLPLVRPVPRLGGFLVFEISAASKQRVLFTADMVQFSPVKNASGLSDLAWVAELPDQSAALLTTKQGLALVRPCVP